MSRDDVGATWILRAARPAWVTAGYPIEEFEVYGRAQRLCRGRKFVADNDDGASMFIVSERFRADEEAAP